MKSKTVIISIVSAIVSIIVVALMIVAIVNVSGIKDEVNQTTVSETTGAGETTDYVIGTASENESVDTDKTYGDNQGDNYAYFDIPDESETENQYKSDKTVKNSENQSVKEQTTTKKNSKVNDNSEQTTTKKSSKTNNNSEESTTKRNSQTGKSGDGWSDLY